MKPSLKVAWIRSEDTRAVILGLQSKRVDRHLDVAIYRIGNRVVASAVGRKTRHVAIDRVDVLLAVLIGQRIDRFNKVGPLPKNLDRHLCVRAIVPSVGDCHSR